MNLLDIYADLAGERGDEPAITYARTPKSHRVLSWGDLLERGQELASALRRAGVRPGSRLAVEVTDHPDAIPAMLAVWACESVAVVVDPWWGESTLSSVLEHSGAAFLVQVDGGFEITRLGSGPPSARDRPDLPAGAAALAYTSGSTGAPKAIVLDHGRLAASLFGAAASIEAYRGGPPSTFGSSLRLSGFGVMVAHFLWSAAAGAHVVVLPQLNISNAGQYWSLLHEHGIDQAVLVPPLFELLVRTSKIDPSYEPPLFINTSGPLTEAAHARFQDRFGARLLNCYGLTEATFAITLGDTSTPDRPSRSIGYPYNLRLRLQASDGSIVAGLGTGELQAYGPSISDGYYDNPVANETLWSGRWMRTGDLGRRDADGRYWIVGRLKDAVMKGGHTVYLTEVEEACLTVDGVVEAVAVRLDLAAGAEDIGLLVRAEAGSDLDPIHVQSALERLLGRERSPRRTIAVTEPLPRIGQDKLDRRSARALWESLTAPPSHSGAAAP